MVLICFFDFFLIMKELLRVPQRHKYSKQSGALAATLSSVLLARGQVRLSGGESLMTMGGMPWRGEFDTSNLHHWITQDLRHTIGSGRW